ncbi:hypothetical protein [Kosakonia sp. YIM B13611]|uniref:hypothetical protein n=1 Tax=unclassified Kosakonia TaxID=2632876 RepID=UPI003674D9E8
MSSCTYSIESYVTLLKMSHKKRVLVEGRDDRKHITNLLNSMIGSVNIKIDTAQDIRAENKAASKNNRLKVEIIHSKVKGNVNVYFLCDREFRGFSLNETIIDEIGCHYENESLFWTLGHSMENYFFSINVLIDAYKYLCGSEFKYGAVELFSGVIECAFSIISAFTLAGRDIEKESYCLSLVKWTDFIIKNNKLVLKNRDELSWDDNELTISLIGAFNRYLPLMEATAAEINARLCRGHSGMILLQRIFSACLYIVGKDIDEDSARESANRFSNIPEDLLANALSESWVRNIQSSNASYPELLLNRIVA